MNDKKTEAQVAQEVTNSELAEVNGGAVVTVQVAPIRERLQQLAPGIRERLDNLALTGLRALEVDQLRVGNGFFAFRFKVD